MLVYSHTSDLPFTAIQKDPPAAISTILPRPWHFFKCLGVCICWISSWSSWLYSELPQPNNSPLSEIDITFSGHMPLQQTLAHIHYVLDYTGSNSNQQKWAINSENHNFTHKYLYMVLTYFISLNFSNKNGYVYSNPKNIHTPNTLFEVF